MLFNVDGRIADGHPIAGPIMERVSEVRTGTTGQLNLVLRAAACVANLKSEVFERPQAQTTIDRRREGL
jgi:hypothetical protein